MENRIRRYSGSNNPVYAYKVLSHLVDHGEMKFIEMRELLGIGHDGYWYKHLLLYICYKIYDLEEEWDESIPPIYVLVFKTDGKSTSKACEYFGDQETQPTPQQIKEVKRSVDAYGNWDKVLEAFRVDIPDKQ